MRAVSYRDTIIRIPWASASRLDVWVAAYGPKALALTARLRSHAEGRNDDRDDRHAHESPRSHASAP